jgi:hypothetical protein
MSATARPPRAEISETSLAYLLELARTGSAISDIAAVIGLQRQTVAGIINGKFYRDLLPDLPRRTATGKWRPLEPTAREIEIVTTCCASDLDPIEAARQLGVSESYCRAIRRGEYMAWVLPGIERRAPDQSVRTCCSCRFYTGRPDSPCDLRLPDATGTAAARTCGSYLS